jgi:hypothetical protein
MGTNYYWHNPNPCAECGHDPNEPKHIGKSSMGWVFALRVYPDEGIEDLDDWREQWETGGRIKDEYGREISVAEMLETITERRRDPRNIELQPSGYGSWDEFHRMNQSEPGPENSGLVRARRDRVYRHGSGTWDCHTGDFS